MEKLEDFLILLKKNIEDKKLLRITLSKPKDSKGDLKNVYIRIITLKDCPKISLVYKYETKDETKNFDLEPGYQEINHLIEKKFKNATMMTHDWNYQLMTSKKGRVSVKRTKSDEIIASSSGHDRVKKKYVTGSEDYLKLLGVAHDNGTIIPKMADKFRQINKYLEIVSGLIQTTQLPHKLSVVDMGSGKGYLTFALYDYLKNKLEKDVQMTGVEIRSDLVSLCSEIASKCNFHNLKFEASSIQDFSSKKIDILIALHACDTATDDALSSGISANASLIISAPCCHKQLRQQVKGKEQNSPLLKYGIFKERQFEMITDTLRALILEKKQYQTKIFEFVSNEHTRKNILLVGTKSSKTPNDKVLTEKIDELKSAFGIEEHYLEQLIEE